MHSHGETKVTSGASDRANAQATTTVNRTNSTQFDLLLVFMLPIVTGLTHRYKPLDWLSAYVSSSILFVVHLCGTRTAIHAAIPIAFQN